MCDTNHLRVRPFGCTTAATVLAVICCGACWGQCPEGWLPGGGTPGVNGAVTAMTLWDPDGEGPQREVLVAGGGFTFAGAVETSFIAAWDGLAWSPLGIGISGPYPAGYSSTVNALTTYNGDLIAGGNFTTIAGVSGVNRVARWDGVAWSALGGGLNDAVSSLTVFNGELIAGGSFINPGGVNHVARWDGVAWSALGSGMDAFVAELIVSDDQLIAGGGFTTAGGVSANRIARWDGASWSPLGTGMNGAVYALAATNGQLFAGGAFTTAGGVSAMHIARWEEGSWHALGSGIDAAVGTLTISDNQLIAGGMFTTAGDVSAACIARWDGLAWNPLGSGMNGPVRALAVHDGELIAGGAFSTAGGVDANCIARWSGREWLPLDSGVSSWVEALTVHNGDLIVGGWFSSAGGVTVNRIARWDGSAWHALGCGMSYPSGPSHHPYPQSPRVYALTVFNGELIAGGRFTVAGLCSANHIARWDGSSWYAVGSGFDGPYSDPVGYIAYVYALAVFNGDLIAGGFFTEEAGSFSFVLHSLARWDGSSWTSLGGGVDGGLVAPPFVETLVLFGSDLVAGGHFHYAGGVFAKRIARWNGAVWSPLGSGMNAEVYALIAHNGELIAGGNFTTAGGQTSAYMARWGIDAPLSPADLTGDCGVDGFDLAKLLGAWGRCETPASCASDLSGDGVVDAIDVAILLQGWSGSA
jgi:Domain of unknown function (DUF5122) beta-propeller